MDTSTRQLFAQQLGHWAQAAISNGRSPFRKVETCASILTAHGRVQPPLVLWVNRDSCMAGGLIFFPDSDLQPDLVAGERSARALGLRHFVTWGAQEVWFWEISDRGLKRLRSFPLPAAAAQSPAVQHDLLLRILDELKLLAVLGTVPPEQLDPDYLANLCYGALETAHPSLCETVRLAQGENLLSKQGSSPETLAWGKGTLVLARLLALLLHDRLPLSLQPEGLERAMQFALDTLPAELASSLRPADDEVSLPQDGAIRFHHLFRRLNQLRPAIDRQRAGQALTTLSLTLAYRLGIQPPPFAIAQPSAALLLVHAEPSLAKPPLAFCATAPWLAIQALRRQLQRLPPIPWQSSDLFALSGTCNPSLIAGTLTDQNSASAPRRQGMTTQLRSSWPNRRFALNAACPVWLWECLHLLGLTATDGIVELRLPADWLCADYGLLLHQLLCEQFTLDRLEEEGTTLRLRAIKQLDSSHPVQLRGSAGERSLPWGDLNQQHRGYLRLALALPEPLWQLLQQGQLRCAQAAPADPEQSRALFVYSRSSLARQLWAALSGGLPLPTATNMGTALPRFGLPVPGPETLNGLLRLAGNDPEKSPVQSEVDRELGLWLGIDPNHCNLPAPTPRRRAAPAACGARREQLAEQILAATCRDGVPRFPEHYLYDHYRPELRQYRFTGELRDQGAFFGRHTLVDSAGQCLDIEGSETVQALLLAASLGSSAVALPVDRELTASILARYCNDLRSLRQNLIRQAYQQATDPTLAEQLVEQLWKSLPVPAWNLLEP